MKHFIINNFLSVRNSELYDNDCGDGAVKEIRVYIYNIKFARDAHVVRKIAARGLPDIFLHMCPKKGGDNERPVEKREDQGHLIPSLRNAIKTKCSRKEIFMNKYLIKKKKKIVAINQLDSNLHNNGKQLCNFIHAILYWKKNKKNTNLVIF